MIQQGDRVRVTYETTYGSEAFEATQASMVSCERIERPARCPARFSLGTARNGVTVLSCEHDEGHEGDHLAYELRWTA